MCWMYSSSAPTLASPEEVPDEDRQPGQSVALRVDDPQREHRERERPQEERHGQPAVVIVEQGLDDAGRELAHRDLHGDEREAEHDAREREDRLRNLLEDRLRGARVACDRLADRAVADRAVDAERREAQDDAAAQSQQRHDPQALHERDRDRP